MVLMDGSGWVRGALWVGNVAISRLKVEVVMRQLSDAAVGSAVMRRCESSRKEVARCKVDVKKRRYYRSRGGR